MGTLMKRIAVGVVALGLAVALVVATGQATPQAAHASGGDSIVLGRATLLNRVQVQVEVTFTCTLPSGAQTSYTQTGITITQAVGQTITSAQGGFPISVSDCDGESHTVVGTVMPTAGSTPFHGGPAIANAYFYMSYYDPNTYTSGQAYAGTGDVSIRIGG